MKILLPFLMCLGTLDARILIDETPRPPGRLARRRMAMEHSSHVDKLVYLQGCPGEVCATLAGEAIAPLLAGSDECAQQDMADKIIDAARNESIHLTPEIRRKMIDIAIEYRKAEKNAHPIYANPLVPRNSVYCQKAPKNPELNGLVQKQDPANGPLLFFDHLVKTNGSTVLLDSQPNTRPFGETPGTKAGTGATTPPNQKRPDTSATLQSSNGTPDTTSKKETEEESSCVEDDEDNTEDSDTSPSKPPTDAKDGLTLQDVGSGKQGTGTGKGGSGTGTTDSVSGGGENTDKADDAEKSGTTGTPGGDETTHKADQTTSKNKGCGGGDDHFDDHNNAGHNTPTTLTGAVPGDGGAALLTNPANPVTKADGGPTTNDTQPTPAIIDVTKIPNKECQDMRIEFGSGFPGRAPSDRTYQPLNTKIFTHGPALNLQIITQFMCDTLHNTCGVTQADDTLFLECRKLSDTIGKVVSKGSKADEWNAAFGYQTNYVKKEAHRPGSGGKGDGKALAPVASADPKPTPGNGGTPPMPGSGGMPGAGGMPGVGGATPPAPGPLPKLDVILDVSKIPDPRCRDMRIQFGAGLPGREAKDLAYQPLNEIFDHGPALNMHIITEFMCDTLHNKCGVKQSDDAEIFTPCKNLSDALGKSLKDGSRANFWNAAFGYVTDYAKDKANGLGTGGKGDGKLDPDALSKFKAGTTSTGTSPPAPSPSPVPTPAPSTNDKGDQNKQMDMNNQGNMMNQMDMNNP